MKVLSILVSVCMLVSCRWSEVPVQECYPSDTTGVVDTVVVWEEWAGGEITSTGFLDISTTSEWVWPKYSEAIEELLELYKEYETQCWNDSTFGFWAGDEYPYEAVWIHKAPTFSGFIEYLRKK